MRNRNPIDLFYGDWINIEGLQPYRMRVYCVVGSRVFPVFPVSYVFLAELLVILSLCGEWLRYLVV